LAGNRAILRRIDAMRAHPGPWSYNSRQVLDAFPLEQTALSVYTALHQAPEEKHAMINETLLTLAADIVSAHVGHNTVAGEDLPRLIQSVYGSLERLGEEVAEEHKPAPAVSIAPR
jgi:hypothetical protein